MTGPPKQPKICHITHVDNLPAIVAEGGLLSDRAMIDRSGPTQSIGMSTIKRRRVHELTVPCHPGTKVGDFVPFNFWPRSVMLYVVAQRNHPELAYRGGQGPIVHLVADLHRVVEWAEAEGVPWCFSLSNAGAYYTEFCAHLDDLSRLDWAAIKATDFRERDVREHKQAEFLLHGRFPVELIERVGVRSSGIQTKAAAAFANMVSPPKVELKRSWYY